MKKSFIAPFCFVAWMQLSISSAFAQASVYSGVYANGEGGLTSSSNWQAVTNFVTNAQKDVSIINNFDSWTDSSGSTNGTQAFPTTEMNNIRNHGSIPMFTWQPQNSTLGVTQSFTLANITNGIYDSYITTWATAAKNWGYPFFLRFAHEMNGNWYPWAASVNGNTASQYIQAWQHVHNIFVSVGATNATWVWCANVVAGMPTQINQVYPGDNYVDWLALDGYNRVTNGWQDFSAIAATTVTQLTNIAPGKPIMLAETGCTQTNYPPETKAQWFLAALTNYVASTPRIKAWVYFNSTNSAGEDWRITSPASAVTGYQQGIGLSYYDTNQYGAISSSPIQPLLKDATTTDTMPPFISIVSPTTDLVNTGAVVNFLARASDKSGISNVVFSVNGMAMQTNNTPPYQFSWTVPVGGGITYTGVASAYDNAGNSAVSTIQIVTQGIAVTNSVTNILQTISQFTPNQPVSPGDWTVAIWGSPAAVATNGNNYETTNSLYVRTPNSITPAAFAGNSLQIDSGGTLYLKNGGETSGNAATVNLLLNGGDMRFHGGFAVNGPAVSGTIQVLANSVIDTDQMPPNNGDIWVQSSISGSGNLTVNMTSYTNSLILSGNNSAYDGNWTNASTFGNIKIVGGTANAFGSGGITLVNAGSWLIFNSTNNLTVNNSISGLGSVLKQNTNMVALNGDSTFTGSLQITSGVLQLGGSDSIDDASVIRLSSGAVLDVTPVSGFIVGSLQTLAGVGSVLGNVTVDGAVSPGPLGTLNFSNSLALSGTAIMEINRTNAQNADLISAATLTLGGTLTVTNIGGALQVGDSFQLFSGTNTGTFTATNLPALPSTNLFWDMSKLNSQGILAVAKMPAVPPAILPPTWNGTNLTLQTSSQTGYNYVLQATAQLAPANWTAIQTNAGGGLLTFTIPISATAQQFFRIYVQ